MFKDPKKRPEVRRAKARGEGCMQGLDNEAPRARHTPHRPSASADKARAASSPVSVGRPPDRPSSAISPARLPTACQRSQALGAEAERAGALMHRKESRGAGVWAERWQKQGGSTHKTGCENGGMVRKRGAPEGISGILDRAAGEILMGLGPWGWVWLWVPAMWDVCRLRRL